MEYFAGLDVSMEATHVCVVDRDGAVIHQAKAASTPADIAQELAKAPACRRVVFETGRMAPVLFHGLAEHSVPVVCVESRQAYQGRGDTRRQRLHRRLLQARPAPLRPRRPQPSAVRKAGRIARQTLSTQTALRRFVWIRPHRERGDAAVRSQHDHTSFA